MSSQSGRPKPADVGTPIGDGVIRDWLLLIDYSGALGDDEAARKLAQSQPDENEAAGELRWRGIRSETSTLDVTLFAEKDKKSKASVAYAHAYFYSKSGQPVAIQSMWDGRAAAWVNGEQVFKGTPGQTAAWRSDLKLVKGWNRILVRTNVSGGSYLKKEELNWYFRMDFYGATGRPLDKSKNILWTVPVRGTGISSPIVVGKKLFLTEENGALTCLDKDSGTVLWRRTTTYADAATDEERKAQSELFAEIDPLAAKVKEANASNALADRDVETKINRLMHKVDREKYFLPTPGDGGCGAPTPTSDGQNVYVLNAMGFAACFDLDGNRKWVTALRFDTGEHGASSSPLLIDGKLVVFYIHWKASDPTSAVGIDAKTGQVVWQFVQKIGYSFHSSPVAMALKGRNYFVTPVWAGTPEDGKMFYDRGSVGGNITVIPSSVVEGNTVINFWEDGLEIVKFDTDTLKPETRKVPIAVHQLPHWYMGWSISSPLYHDGLVYCMSDDGILAVVDVKEGKVLYQKMLDLGLYMHHNLYTSRGGAGSSITLGGKYIYIFGNAGVGLVIEPGRTYKQVARNRIENPLPKSATHGYFHQETYGGCPVFDGDRMYLVAESTLYCIGRQ